MANSKESVAGEAQPFRVKLSLRNKLYKKISGNFSKDDVKSFKALLITDDQIAKGRIEGSMPHEIFNMLEADGKIGKGNLGLLIELLKTLGKTQLAMDAEDVETEEGMAVSNMTKRKAQDSTLVPTNIKQQKVGSDDEGSNQSDGSAESGILGCSASASPPQDLEQEDFESGENEDTTFATVGEVEKRMDYLRTTIAKLTQNPKNVSQAKTGELCNACQEMAHLSQLLNKQRSGELKMDITLLCNEEKQKDFQKKCENGPVDKEIQKEVKEIMESTSDDIVNVVPDIKVDFSQNTNQSTNCSPGQRATIKVIAKDVQLADSCKLDEDSVVRQLFKYLVKNPESLQPIMKYLNSFFVQVREISYGSIDFECICLTPESVVRLQDEYNSQGLHSQFQRVISSLTILTEFGIKSISLAVKLTFADEVLLTPDSEQMDLDMFFRAVEEGDVQTVRRGLQTGVDVNVQRGFLQSTPLHKAAAGGHTETCELLIHHGADLIARDKLQSTPLQDAAAGGHTETCELLIRHGADVLQSTPLHEAAAGGYTGTCELLIHHGADLTARDKLQSTPLHEAAAGGHTETCELLIHHGADVMATTEFGQTPLDVGNPQTRRIMKNAAAEKSYHELMQESGGLKVDRFELPVCGESTLIRSLREGLYTDVQQGPIAALLEELSYSSSAEEPLDILRKSHVPGVGKVYFWDCVGFPVTHNMFIDAKNTVFIVLYNIMNDSETQGRPVHSWLSFIKSFNPNRQPDVILVACHARKVSRDRAERQAARLLQLMTSEFKDHLRISEEVFLMDCKKTQTAEMDRLKKVLAMIKENMFQHQRPMPTLCAEIIRQLPSWCQKKCSPKWPVLRWPEYVDAVREINFHVDENFLLKSTKFLDHLGEILFTCPESSDPIIVLKPNWLCTDIIGPMMAPENFPIPCLERTSEDYVTREEIQRVFQDVADVDLLITLLQEFQLCYSYNGQDNRQRYIFPGLLTQTMPPNKWQPTPEPKVVYFGKQVQCADSTDMFSSGFFPRVQTRLMRELENRPLLWRDGAKCVDRNVEGLIKLSPDGRAVNICVRSVEGDKVQCDKMLQHQENIITAVLEELSPGTCIVEKVISARALREHREEFYSYGKEEISKAAAEGGTIVHPTLGFTEQVRDLLCRGDEDLLIWNRQKLIRALPLRHVESILHHLLELDILTLEECDSVKAHKTPQNMARALLDMVGRKRRRDLEVFKKVLVKVNPYAAELML